jgi:hypothetical protein
MCEHHLDSEDIMTILRVIELTFRTSPDRYSPPVQEPVVAPV